MTFHFRFRRQVQGGTLELGAIVSGFARLAGAATTFTGKLVTFAVDTDVPNAGPATLLSLSPDTGDTGTGTGSQT